MRRRLGLIARIAFSGLVAGLAGCVVFVLAGGYRPLWDVALAGRTFVFGWSPQARYVLTWDIERHALGLRRAEDGELHLALRPREVSTQHHSFEWETAQGFPFFACSADDRRLAVFLEDDPPGILSLIDVDGKQRARKVRVNHGPLAHAYPTGGAGVLHPQFSPDGVWLACRGISAQNEACVYVFRVERDQPPLELPCQPESKARFVGDALLAVDDTVWNVTAGAKHGELPKLPSEFARHVEFKGDAPHELLWLAFVADHQAPPRLALFQIDARGLTLRQLWEHSFPAGQNVLIPGYGIGTPSRLLELDTFDHPASRAGVRAGIRDVRSFQELGQATVFGKSTNAMELIMIAASRAGAQTSRIEFLTPVGRLAGCVNRRGSFMINLGYRPPISDGWPSWLRKLLPFGDGLREELTFTDLETGSIAASPRGEGFCEPVVCDPAGERVAVASHGGHRLELWPIPPSRPWAAILGVAAAAGAAAFGLPWALRRRASRSDARTDLAKPQTPATGTP